MKEDFVSFDLAEKLKEKGFMEKCLCRYRKYSKTLQPNEVQPKIARKIDYSEFFKCYNSYIDNDIDAPTISQVLKWLREKNIILSLIPSYFEGNICLGWDCDIWVNGNYEHRCVSNYSYESAALTGVAYCLENLI